MSEGGERIRRRFVLGLVIITPIFITVWVIITITNLFVGWLANTLSSIPVLKPLPYPLMLFISAVFVLMVIYLVGLVASTYVGKVAIDIMDTFVLNIPVLNYVYRISKETVKAFYNLPTKRVFKGVVWVKMGENAKILGFITDIYGDIICVFIPSTPNPTTGFTLLVSKENIENADMGVEDGLKFVISGGIVNVFQKGRIG